jgi:hypothetical protein
MKGCQLYATHVEDPTKCTSPSLEEFLVFKEYVDVFEEIPGLPPKRDIDFSIDLIPRAIAISKNPYIMSTLELKELQMKL